MQAILYLIGIIAVIIFLASVFPISQCVYYKLIHKEEMNHRYLFSEDLFDRHMSYDIGLNDIRVIHNRSELDRLIEIEMGNKLP